MNYYLFAILDNIKFVFIVLSVISFFAIPLVIGAMCEAGIEGKEFFKTLKITTILFVFLATTTAFIPNQKQAAFIFIAPQIIENGAVKNTVKNIPELTELATEFLKETLKTKILEKKNVSAK